jgi:uncharacterized protein YkwD
MHSSVFAVALLVASVVASPIQRVRDVVDTDVVYVTQTFYATVGTGQGYRKHKHTEVQTQSAPTVVVTGTPTPPPAPEDPATPAPATPSADAAPGPSSTPSAYVPGNDYTSNAVNSHNVHRSNHSAPAVAWDTDLASIAAQIASSCVFAHDT